MFSFLSFPTPPFFPAMCFSFHTWPINFSSCITYYQLTLTSLWRALTYLLSHHDWRKENPCYCSFTKSRSDGSRTFHHLTPDSFPRSAKPILLIIVPLNWARQLFHMPCPSSDILQKIKQRDREEQSKLVIHECEQTSVACPLATKQYKATVRILTLKTGTVLRSTAPACSRHHT